MNDGELLRRPKLLERTHHRVQAEVPVKIGRPVRLARLLYRDVASQFVILAIGVRYDHVQAVDSTALKDRHENFLPPVTLVHRLTRGELVKKTLVITKQSNLGVDAAIAAAGGRVVRTNVGDRYVIQQMLAEGATLGGESSGHIICSDISPTGDGLVAALKIIDVMLAREKPLSQLRRALSKFPQLTSALKVREKKSLETLPCLSAEILEVERELGSKGRVLVRYSGTEPKLRLLVEGPSSGVVQAAMSRLEKAARAELQVI